MSGLRSFVPLYLLVVGGWELNARVLGCPLRLLRVPQTGDTVSCFLDDGPQKAHRSGAHRIDHLKRLSL